MNEVIKQLYERKSVRVFEDRKISNEDKKVIIESAIQAPTAGNQCMYTIIDVTDPDLLAKLAESCDHQPFIKDAKLALIFVADFQKWYDAFTLVDKDVRTPKHGDLMIAVDDALIAAQNAVVAAQSLGIGSCYIGDIMEQCEYHKQLLNLPQYTFPAAFVVFGYPTKQQEERKKPSRFTYEDLVCENKYIQKDEEQLKQMFIKRGLKDNEQFDFDIYMKAFCNRKYASDFSKEMSRSVKAYLNQFE